MKDAFCFFTNQWFIGEKNVFCIAVTLTSHYPHVFCIMVICTKITSHTLYTPHLLNTDVHGLIVVFQKLDQFFHSRLYCSFTLYQS
jgi:predicted ABC-type exoprotein transport system permease subunit